MTRLSCVAVDFVRAGCSDRCPGLGVRAAGTALMLDTGSPFSRRRSASRCTRKLPAKAKRCPRPDRGGSGTSSCSPPTLPARSIPSEMNGRLMFAPPKTSAGSRTVALPQFLVEVMVEHVARFSQSGPEGLVFVMPEGTPLRRENFRRRVWYPAVKSAGMAGFRFHDLRHTNATLAAASGAPLPALMARLGHASAAAAIRYQHKIQGQDEAVADFLETVGRAVAQVGDEHGRHHARSSLQLS